MRREYIEKCASLFIFPRELCGYLGNFPAEEYRLCSSGKCVGEKSENISEREINYEQNEKVCTFCKWKTVVFKSSRCHRII